MTAILILLGMLSLTLIASNLGFLTKTKVYSYISVPLILGIVFSPEGLIPILPSTREGLTMALKVALCWIAFLAGTRLIERKPGWTQVKKLIPIFIGYLFFFGIIFFIIERVAFQGTLPKGMLQFDSDSFEALAVALILSSTLFSSKENPFVLTLFFFSLFALFNSGPLNFTLISLLTPLVVGLLMGVIGRLVISRTPAMDAPERLKLLGLCILGTGWAIGSGTMEILVGLSFGWLMAVVNRDDVVSDLVLSASKEPIDFAIPLFAGLYVKLSFEVIVIGLALALSRILVKYVVLYLGYKRTDRNEILTTIIPISSFALPVLLSLHLSPFRGDITYFILSCFCVGFIANDIFALSLEILKRKSLSGDVKL